MKLLKEKKKNKWEIQMWIQHVLNEWMNIKHIQIKSTNIINLVCKIYSNNKHETVQKMKYMWNKHPAHILSFMTQMSHMTADNLITISLYLHAKDTSRNSVYLISDIITLTSSSFLMKKNTTQWSILFIIPSQIF